MSERRSKDLTAKIQRFHLGVITGVFMAAAYILAMMGHNTLPVLSDLYVTNELYFILFVLTVGFLIAQIFIWRYNKGRKL